MDFIGDPTVDYFALTDVVAEAARPYLPARYEAAGIPRATAMQVAIRLARKGEVKDDPAQTIEHWKALLTMIQDDPAQFEQEVYGVLVSV